MMTTKSGSDLELPQDTDARRIAIKNHFPVDILCPVCGKTAFFYRNLPVKGRQFDAGDALYHDGSKPYRLHPDVVCGTCHDTVPANRMTWRGKSW